MCGQTRVFMALFDVVQTTAQELTETLLRYVCQAFLIKPRAHLSLLVSSRSRVITERLRDHMAAPYHSYQWDKAAGQHTHTHTGTARSVL